VWQPVRVHLREQTPGLRRALLAAQAEPRLLAMSVAAKSAPFAVAPHFGQVVRLHRHRRQAQARTKAKQWGLAAVRGADAPAFPGIHR